VPHISLVFREMWDATALHLHLSKVRKTLSFVVSHISRKTSEIWGTPRFLEGKERTYLINLGSAGWLEALPGHS
jgi:hypothetical protein